VRRGLAAFPAVEFHPGWIPQSFAGLREMTYRFVHLDLDLHDPTLAALEYFYPRMVKGGILVCDDYSWPGARKAIEDFCARHRVAFEATPHGQAVLRREA
jgi:predicted O-methyltransferase YrrM